MCPERNSSVTRTYLPETMVLRSEFMTEGGVLCLEDLLAVGPNEDEHDLGAHTPHALLRRARCLSGSVALKVEFRPKPEYGLVIPRLENAPGGVRGTGGAVRLFLSTSLALTMGLKGGHALVRLDAGDTLRFALEARCSSDTTPRHWPEDKFDRYFEGTIDAWRRWSRRHQRYQGPYSEMVHHSGRVLQALTYYPTGAIVAAPTTSLPEDVGGTRNWDYRFTWVRDASLTLNALWVAACPDEAEKFFDYMAGTALSQIQEGLDMQIVFGVGGEHDLFERELRHLSGWRGSSPVRVGNAAWSQRQIDVYGEVMDAAHQLRDYLGDSSPTTLRFLVEVAEAARRRWQEKDRGIWEVRGGEKHFLHSKLMCWVALDRAVALADLLHAAEKVSEWYKVREEIRSTILTRGWNSGLGAFTQALDDNVLDASTLLLPIMGLLPANDPRALSTMDALEYRLSDRNGLLYRYTADDGLEGTEGAFLLCSFWLAQARALAGDTRKARAILERCVSHANEVGLLSEQVSSDSGEMVGNFPQAFSHIGLVNAAWTIAVAEGAGEDEP